MADRVDPYRNFRFRVEIDGIIQAGFNEVTMPDSTTDPVEYREGTDNPNMRKLTGLTKGGNITLKWGTTTNLEFFNWRQLVIDGNVAEARKKSMAVVLKDEMGKDAARWEFSNVWPTKYKPADMSAKANDVAIETLELVHEGMKRVS
jgi:phage tail-like protein